MWANEGLRLVAAPDTPERVAALPHSALVSLSTARADAAYGGRRRLRALSPPRPQFRRGCSPRYQQAYGGRCFHPRRPGATVGGQPTAPAPLLRASTGCSELVDNFLSQRPGSIIRTHVRSESNTE